MGAVVGQLLDRHGIDTFADLKGGEREGLAAEAGIDARGEERRAARAAGQFERVDDASVGGRWVDEIHHRARHHVGPRSEDLLEVLHGGPAPGLAHRGEDDAVGSQGQQCIGVVDGRHAGRDVETAQLGGVAPGAIGRMAVQADELELRTADQGLERLTADAPDGPLNDAVGHRHPSGRTGRRRRRRARERYVGQPGGRPRAGRPPASGGAVSGGGGSLVPVRFLLAVVRRSQKRVRAGAAHRCEEVRPLTYRACSGRLSTWARSA